MVERRVALQQAPQRGRGRDADVGHERHARLDLAAVGIATLADEQVVGRQLARLLPRPFDAAEGVRQPVARALAQQRLDQAREVARVRGQAARLEPVLRDLFLDLAVDGRVDELLDAGGRLSRDRPRSFAWGQPLIQAATAEVERPSPARLPRRRGPRSGYRAAGSRVRRRAARSSHSRPSGKSVSSWSRRRTLVHFEERLVEPLEPCLEDLAGVGRRDALHLDLVLGDAVPGRLRDDVARRDRPAASASRPR